MTTMDYTHTMKEPSPRFWDRIADRYAKRPVADETAYQKKLQITRDYLAPNMKLLEFGCGTGTTALSHAPLVDRILAIDISSRMIEIAQQKAEASGAANIVFTRASIDTFQAPAGSFDVVLGLSILHLLDDRDEAIAKVHSLLKPGGVFISSTACLGDTMKIFKLIGPLGRGLGLLPLLRVFTTTDLVGSLKRQDFALERQWTPGKGKSVFIVARKLA